MSQIADQLVPEQRMGGQTLHARRITCTGRAEQGNPSISRFLFNYLMSLC